MKRKSELEDFYNGRTVLVTGHTGFKGSWMVLMLKILGANVYGYSLAPPTIPSLYKVGEIENYVHSFEGDIRNMSNLKNVFDKVQPEIVFHMAAQPIVRESYRNPVYTYETNVMGTVNLLECVRNCDSVRSVVNITTDKVYRNEERETGYVEDEYLDGYDPYSNSKSCSELVTSAYRNSFFSISKGDKSGNLPAIDGNDKRICAISTCRAGNVIGGGDFAKDRIIPDCVRAAVNGEPIVVRNPNSVRPYQHVLEPIYAYLLLAMEQYKSPIVCGAYNIGPNDTDCKSTKEVVNTFCETWNRVTGSVQVWRSESDDGPHEATFLKLNCDKFKTTFSWNSRWGFYDCMENLVEWYVAWNNEEDLGKVMESQIKKFLSE